MIENYNLVFCVQNWLIHEETNEMRECKFY